MPLEEDIPFEGYEPGSRAHRYDFSLYEDNFSDCVRCGEAPARDREGYCGHCHWVVAAEVDEGFYYIGRYLRNWAKFREWEAQHDTPVIAASLASRDESSK